MKSFQKLRTFLRYRLPLTACTVLFLRAEKINRVLLFHRCFACVVVSFLLVFVSDLLYVPLKKVSWSTMTMVFMPAVVCYSCWTMVICYILERQYSSDGHCADSRLSAFLFSPFHFHFFFPQTQINPSIHQSPGWATKSTTKAIQKTFTKQS